jgi:hypothetical protein
MMMRGAESVAAAAVVRGATLAVMGRGRRAETVLALASESGEQLIYSLSMAFGAAGFGVRGFNEFIESASALQTLKFKNRHFIMIQRIRRFVNIFFKKYSSAAAPAQNYFLPTAR